MKKKKAIAISQNAWKIQIFSRITPRNTAFFWVSLTIVKINDVEL
jgi:hypothetical protein